MPGLKFIADMDISPLTVDRLKERGWEIIRVSDVMDARTSDIEILSYARDHNNNRRCQVNNPSTLQNPITENSQQYKITRESASQLDLYFEEEE